MNRDFFHINLEYLPASQRQSITEAKDCGTIIITTSGHKTLLLDGKYLHSKHDPLTESKRLTSSLRTNEEKIFLFFGAGLGYTIEEILLHSNNVHAVWMEPFPCILKHAFQYIDFSRWLTTGRLKIILPPFSEDDLFPVFRGLANLPVSFMPHRGSISWQHDKYTELRFIAERFFKKKDVNIATLSRFETIWTRNMIQNLPAIMHFAPVASLSGIAPDVPVLVAGAGPSLYQDLPLLKKYRDRYILIAVDTAVSVLQTGGVDPDLIYSVDPQYINTKYLEAYQGNGFLIFDSTSSYHTLRLNQFKNGFITASPFPLLQVLTKFMDGELGQPDFGGSVSTNAASLANWITNSVYLVGQDLAFTGGHAHARGAVLEERLNLYESRYNRREKHNYKQLHWLPVKQVEGKNGKFYPTNEKMLIFHKWFSDHGQEQGWINLTSDGSIIPGLKTAFLEETLSHFSKDRIRNAKDKIQTLASQKLKIDTDKFILHMKETINGLQTFKKILEEGVELSYKIYNMIASDCIETKELNRILHRMTSIDDMASSRKGLNDLIGTSMQRIVLMITEGYETTLTNAEKANEQLGSAKKSILLYEGLLSACNLNRRLLKKSLLLITSYPHN